MVNFSIKFHRKENQVTPIFCSYPYSNWSKGHVYHSIRDKSMAHSLKDTLVPKLYQQKAYFPNHQLIVCVPLNKSVTCYEKSRSCSVKPMVWDTRRIRRIRWVQCHDLQHGTPCDTRLWAGWRRLHQTPPSNVNHNLKCRNIDFKQRMKCPKLVNHWSR